MKITFASEIGKRNYQEDSIGIFEDNFATLLAVFDGHGGHWTSEMAVRSVEAIWMQTSGTPVKRIKETFKILNKITKGMDSGSTASLVHIENNTATCGVLGDIPILVKGVNGRVWRSVEHNVRSNEKEAASAIKRGGWISQGYLFANTWGGGLQMSRALGDVFLNKVLLRQPQISTRLLGPDSWVLVATDGLFDPAHESSDHKEIVKMIEDGADAQKLCDYAVSVPTHDNVSAILVRV